MTRDYSILCLTCGNITAETLWTYWQLSDDGERWLPSLRSKVATMIRCPSCGREHIDGDAGIFYGAELILRRRRREVADTYLDQWAALAAKGVLGA